MANADDDYDKLEDTFVTRTIPNARYTHIVAESDYLEDFKDGSEYTLRHRNRTIQRSTSNNQKKNI